MQLSGHASQPRRDITNKLLTHLPCQTKLSVCFRNNRYEDMRQASDHVYLMTSAPVPKKY